MMSKPRWSLGTLLVLTAICGWAMLYWPWIMVTTEPQNLGDWMAGKPPQSRYEFNLGALWPISVLLNFFLLKLARNAIGRARTQSLRS